VMGVPTLFPHLCVSGNSPFASHDDGYHGVSSAAVVNSE